MTSSPETRERTSLKGNMAGWPFLTIDSNTEREREREGQEVRSESDELGEMLIVDDAPHFSCNCYFFVSFSLSGERFWVMKNKLNF